MDKGDLAKEREKKKDKLMWNLRIRRKQRKAKNIKETEFNYELGNKEIHVQT